MSQVSHVRCQVSGVRCYVSGVVCQVLRVRNKGQHSKGPTQILEKVEYGLESRPLTAPTLRV